MESVLPRHKLNSQLFHYTASKSLRSILICLVLILVYYLINTFLFSHGFSSQVLLYLGEKALLVFKGNPPRIENIGFVYPPFPYFFILLFRNPFFASALIGGISATFFLLYLWHNLYVKKTSNILFSLCATYLLLSPLSIYLFTEQLPSNLLIVLILFSYHLLYSYSQTYVSIYLFLFGLLSALIFFIHLEVAIIMAVWTLPCTIIIKKHGKQHFSSVFIVTYFPLIFFVLSWLYLNWLFMGNPLHFIHSWIIALFSEGFELKSQINGIYFIPRLKLAIKEVVYNFPILLPYAILLFTLIISKKRNIILLSILSFPLILFLIDILLGGILVVIGQHFFLIFIATSIYVFIKHNQLNIGSNTWKLFNAALFISLCYSFYSPLFLGSHEERLFSKAYYGYSNFQNYKNQKKLLEKISEEGKILLDDSTNYSFVYVLNDPQRFLLPYEYEFETALVKPELFVKYIIISNEMSTDQIIARHPSARYGQLNEFNFIGQFGKYQLYQRIKNSPENYISEEKFP